VRAFPFKPHYAERLKNIGTESAFEVLASAKELERKGIDVVHLEIGEPDFDTPPHIKEAAYRALEKGYTHYTPSPGLPELREAIAERLAADMEVELDPGSEIIVMPGAKMCIFSAILATINPGDEVLVPDPGWPIYESVVRFVGGRPIAVPLREDDDFRFQAHDLEKRITARTRMMILNFPHNPCGSNLSKEDVEAISEIAKRREMWVISDEIYSKIVYDSPHYSVLLEDDMRERTIYVNGLSKTYAMTGWRLGYAIANPQLISRMVTLQINITSCPTAFAQLAAVEALRGPQDCVAEMVREYDRRRRAIVGGLKKIEGISCQMPAGAFYAFPNVEALGLPSKLLMKQLLEEAHVATLDGTAFGSNGEGHLRLSYANSIEEIEKGLDRIRRFVEHLRQRN